MQSGSPSAKDLNRVIVTVADDGEIKCGVMKSGYDETHVGEMAALCVLQIKRIHEASTKMLGHFTKEKKYSPWKYTLGADFP